eukprot:SAG31_NODE_893_length_11177_cov_10.241806_11_plen_55_part_00
MMIVQNFCELYRNNGQSQSILQREVSVLLSSTHHHKKSADSRCFTGGIVFGNRR